MTLRLLAWKCGGADTVPVCSALLLAVVFRHEPYNLKVDVYSFAMIIFQLFETTTPFHGHDPVDAARQAAMLGARPGFPPRRNLAPMTQVCTSPCSMCHAAAVAW